MWTAIAWNVGVDDEVDKPERREYSLTVGGRIPERIVSVSSRSRGPVPRWRGSWLDLSGLSVPLESDETGQCFLTVKRENRRFATAGKAGCRQRFGASRCGNSTILQLELLHPGANTHVVKVARPCCGTVEGMPVRLVEASCLAQMKEEIRSGRVSIETQIPGQKYL